MKRYTLYILWSIVLLFSSCLSEHPKDQVGYDDVYNSANNIYVNAVASLYNYIGGSQNSEGLQGTCRGIYDYNTLTTDEAMIPIRGGDWYDGALWENMYQHKWTASDPYLYDVWKYLFKVIVLSNQSLEVINTHQSLLTPTQQAEYVAEVRAIRALFYYYAMDMFGRIPLLKSADISVNNVQQSQRSDVFRFIFSELQNVLPLLPAEQSNHEGNYYGRITQPVAMFLLAKLALNAIIYENDSWTSGFVLDGKALYFSVDGKQKNAWETCVYYCEQLRNMGYRLEDNYATNFAVHNEVSQENIFTIPMNKMIYSNQLWYIFRSVHYKHGGAYGWGTENGTCATITTMNAYGYDTSNRDNRFDNNFFADTVRVDGKIVTLDDNSPLVYMPMELKPNLTDSKYKQTAGARMHKYEIDRTAYSDGRLCDNDIVLFRFADALLMEAEAKTRNGEDGSALLHEVRSRVRMPDIPCTLENILQERLRELVWEGWRRQDLIRYGLFNKAYDQRVPVIGEENGYTTVFPIPQKCIDLNKNLKQNVGYDD